MANEFLTIKQAEYQLADLERDITTKVDDAIAALENDPVDVTDSVSVSNNSTGTVCMTAQYGAGVYLVSAYVSFPASSSGRRHMHISTTNTGSALDGWAETTVAPSPTQPTVIQVNNIIKRTSTGRWYLRAYQNSGSTQTVSGGIRVLKLH